MYDADAKHDNAALQHKLQSLYQLRSDSIRINLKSDEDQQRAYKALLERLGSPHLKIKNIIHVAGTNGKGSTLAFIRSVLESSGHSVNLYTSPHLHQFNERIVLDGQTIENTTLETALDDVLTHCSDLPLTFFEVTTALAFHLFAKYHADYTLIETGLGGRLDCTNVVPHPRATIITSIGMDHTEFLGDTLPQIALEKAGIIKEGIPCITTSGHPPSVFDVIKEAAAKKNATLTICDPLDTKMTLGLKGAHQYKNAALAMACVKGILKDNITDDTIESGLAQAHWPARMEHLSASTLPPGYDLWFDGGHNSDAGQALSLTLAEWQEQEPNRPIHVICGMMRNKDPAAFLEPLSKHIDGLHFVPIHTHDDCYSAAELAEITQTEPKLNQIKDRACTAQSIKDAVQNICTITSEPTHIIITGSFYLYTHSTEI
jgi:dihydrofolate synthase/folylpolyglutamate synthase